jgi:hypothetical protein
MHHQQLLLLLLSAILPQLRPCYHFVTSRQPSLIFDLEAETALNYGKVG